MFSVKIGLTADVGSNAKGGEEAQWRLLARCPLFSPVMAKAADHH
jgi:hypothetical protein